METIVRNLVRYLVQHGLLTRAAVIDGGLAVTMSRSRNRYVLVKQRHGPGYFVKQALESEAMTAQTVAREAEVYRGAFGDERLGALRALLPQFHHFDAEQSILAMEMVPEAETLAACHARLGGCPPGLAARIGAALAGYHRIRFVEGRPQAALFPQEPPWILKLHAEPDLANLRRSRAASELIDTLLAAPGLGDRLGALRKGWRRDTLIHGDMRWENLLLAPRKRPLDERRLYVVDWELADIGDASWDLAGMMQAYLNFWIGSMPAQAGLDADALAAAATRPLDTIQPALRALWSAYIEASETYFGDSEAFLERVVAMMAARMLATAFEMSAWAQQLDGRALLIVQTALNVIERPAAAARDLLGIVPAEIPADTPDDVSAETPKRVRRLA